MLSFNRAGLHPQNDAIINQDLGFLVFTLYPMTCDQKGLT